MVSLEKHELVQWMDNLKILLFSTTDHFDFDDLLFPYVDTEDWDNLDSPPISIGDVEDDLEVLRRLSVENQPMTPVQIDSFARVLSVIAKSLI